MTTAPVWASAAWDETYGIGRVGEIGSDGARLRRGSVNMRQFALRDGERLLAGELIGKRFKGERVVDIGLFDAPEHTGWEVLGNEADTWRDKNRGGWDALLPHFVAAVERGAN